MPGASEMTLDDLLDLLAAAAGVAAPESSAGRCLRSALLDTGAIAVLIDGFDELCPSFKEKLLKLLQLLLQQTETPLVWVTSRPEVETSLERVLRCSSASLRALTREEQCQYLRTYWDTSHTKCHVEKFAEKVIDALAKYSNDDHSTGGLLAAPLHLQMVADIFADTTTLQDDLRLDLCDLYQHFIELKHEAYLRNHGFLQANIENSPFPQDVFTQLHTNSAMFLVVADKQFKGIDTQLFEEFITKNEKELQREKTGIMWVDEDKKLHFDHYSFIEYFAASWLCENINSSDIAKAVMRALYEREIGNEISHFLNWMLTKDCPLHRAVLAKDRTRFEDAMCAGESMDRTDTIGRTALHIAVLSNKSEICDALIERKCNVNARDTLFEYTPLQYADVRIRNYPDSELSMSHDVYRSLTTIMEILLNAGAEYCELPTFFANVRRAINIVMYYNYAKVAKLLLEHFMSESDYMYALERAENWKRYNIMHVLLTHSPLCETRDQHLKGEEIQTRSENIRRSVQAFDLLRNETSTTLNTPLHSAAYEGNVATLKNILDTVPDMDVNAETVHGITPLLIAAYKGHHKCVELLIERGSTVNSRDDDGFTPLHVAAQEGHVSVLQKLISAGANVMINNKRRVTSLQLAVLNGHKECTKHLMQNHSQKNKQEQVEFSPLRIAIDMGHGEIVEILLEEGARVNYKHRAELGLLYFAVLKGHKHCLMPLLQCSSDLNEPVKHLYSLIHTATVMGHISILEELLKFGCDPNLKNPQGSTPLHFVAMSDNARCAECLLKYKAKLKDRNREGDEPLHIAVKYNSLKVIRTFLEAGANANSTNKRCETPLHIATIHDHPECVEILLQYGADMKCAERNGHTLLHVAAYGGHHKVIRRLLVETDDVNSKNESGETPLHLATFCDEVECVNSLLENNADPNCADVKENTPLHVAVERGHVRVLIRLLDDSRVHVNSKNRKGETPLYFAVLNNQLKLIDRLIKHDADYNCADDQENSPLHVAAQVGNFGVAKRLLDAGAIFDQKNSSGETPLILAVRSGDVACVQLLLTFGARHDPNNKGLTPLHCAAFEGNTSILECLTNSPCDVNARDGNGDTPLQYATVKGHVDCVKFLLRNGGNVNATNNIGYRILDYCNRNTEIDRVLTDAGASYATDEES